MGLQTLIEKYPEQFARYAEKVLDSYFGNIFVTWRNERILYVNARMAASVRMTKEELTGMTLEQLREKKLWLRSVSREMYDGKKSPFNAYNVSKYGDELFTHIEPICDEKGEVIMSAQFSIPKRMLAEFSDYITQEKSSFRNYKDIADYLEARKEASEVIISNSPAARLAFDDARYLSSMDSTVLLCGETGTGKDVLANYIYHNSKRASQPFVPVNCSAIPAELVESEFFGYERGAFTGARSSGKPGLFEMADHGTLFLDEVGELPPAMQAKLLRVLETGEVMRVGGTRHRQDGRAPDRGHQPGSAAYGGGGTLPGGSVLPPQRHAAVPAAPAGAAGKDILPLAELFLAKTNRKYGLSRALTQEMRRGLLAYGWPGNIRELRNVIERYAISGRMDIQSPAAAAPLCRQGPGGSRKWRKRRRSTRPAPGSSRLISKRRWTHAGDRCPKPPGVWASTALCFIKS